MKKNLVLYLLLVFLVITNAFFLFHFMNNQSHKGPRKDVRPIDFLTNELRLNEEQINKVQLLNKEHHQKMMVVSEDIKRLKDALFNRISADSVDKMKVDSITSLIGEKEKEKDVLTFYHFKKIQELCNDNQKETFRRIVNDALHRNGREGNRPPPRH